MDKPKAKVTALVHDIRLNSGVGSPLRKTAHDLNYSDCILLERETLWDVLMPMPGMTEELLERIEARLWK